MTRLLSAASLLVSLVLFSSCGSSVVGSCSVNTCIDGCCTVATSDAPSRCLREPLNADAKTCGTGGGQCLDCSKFSSADGGATRCVNAQCQ